MADAVLPEDELEYIVPDEDNLDDPFIPTIATSAFKIKLIVENIIKFLPTNDVLSLRCVSRVCRESVRPTLRESSFCVKISNADDLERFLENHDDTDPRDFLIRRIVLDARNNSLSSGSVHLLLSKFGKELTHLTLASRNENDFGSVDAIVAYCTQLKSLYIECPTNIELENLPSNIDLILKNVSIQIPETVNFNKCKPWKITLFNVKFIKENVQIMPTIINDYIDFVNCIQISISSPHSQDKTTRMKMDQNLYSNELTLFHAATMTLLNCSSSNLKVTSMLLQFCNFDTVMKFDVAEMQFFACYDLDLSKLPRSTVVLGIICCALSHPSAAILLPHLKEFQYLVSPDDSSIEVTERILYHLKNSCPLLRFLKLGATFNNSMHYRVKVSNLPRTLEELVLFGTAGIRFQQDDIEFEPLEQGEEQDLFEEQMQMIHNQNAQIEAEQQAHAQENNLHQPMIINKLIVIHGRDTELANIYLHFNPTASILEFCPKTRMDTMYLANLFNTYPYLKNIHIKLPSHSVRFRNEFRVRAHNVRSRHYVFPDANHGIPISAAQFNSVFSAYD